MIQRRDFDPRLVLGKLEHVGRRSNLEAEAFVKGAVKTVSPFGSRSQDAGEFAAMIFRQCRKEISDWEYFCPSAAEKLL